MVGNYATIDRSMLYIDFENKYAEVIGSAETLSMNIYDIKYKHLNNDYYAVYGTTYYRSSVSNDILNHKVYRYILKNNAVILDLYSIEEFGDANILDVEQIEVSGTLYLNVLLISKNDVIFSSVIDMDGNVVIAPTKNMTLSKRSYYEKVLTSVYMDYACYNSCAGVILAQDTETGKMGYIDITGTFVISPVYNSATEFQIIDSTAVAVVDGTTIINSNGEIIFSAQAE